jgi:hypothetical protein
MIAVVRFDSGYRSPPWQYRTTAKASLIHTVFKLSRSQVLFRSLRECLESNVHAFVISTAFVLLDS